MLSSTITAIIDSDSERISEYFFDYFLDHAGSVSMQGVDLEAAQSKARR